MKSIRGLRWATGLMLVTAAASVHSCVLPIPFQYEFQNSVTATLTAANATDPCALSVRTNNSAGPAAAGFLHYRRASPLASVRYGFHFDAGALTGFDTVNRSVMLFSASSPLVSGVVSHLLDIRLLGGNPNPSLRFSTATDQPQSLITQVPVVQSANVLRVEINVGSGTVGSVRYWINHAFSDPPDGVIDRAGAGLNNAALAGVISAEIGLSSATDLYRAEQAGNAIVFDQIESSDDELFFDDFSSGAQ